MIIGLHDADADRFKADLAHKFPNLALMKLSAYHKARGDTVEWFMPLERDKYDIVYSSKIFDFSPDDPYLPENTVKGGTGYGIYDELAPEIDACSPDYSIYPGCDYAIGFLTRGCIRRCRWCVVPRKEGYIHPYRTWREIVRPDTTKLTLMDNNILACPHGIEQLAELSHTDYRLDINQGLDARLVTPEIADILARCKWQKHIRFACDQRSQIESVKNAVKLLTERGIKASSVFVYCLLTDDQADDLFRVYSLRELGSITLYGMPEKNPAQGIMPLHWQERMAHNYIKMGCWRKQDWEDWVKDHGGYFVHHSAYERRITKMTYEIINPSDKCFIEAESDTVAALVGNALGNGYYGVRDENGKAVLHIMQSVSEAVNMTEGELSAFIDSHHREIRKAFESFRYESERTSLNNIEARAQAYVRAFLSKYGV